jgi:hypothetical protein
MAATSGLAASGVRSGRIMAMWALITAVSGIAALAGYGLLGGAPQWAVAFVLAFAAGAVLTMLADTMMPEAFDHGGRVAGLSSPRSDSWSHSRSPTSSRQVEMRRDGERGRSHHLDGSLGGVGSGSHLPHWVDRS